MSLLKPLHCRGVRFGLVTVLVLAGRRATACAEDEFELAAQAAGQNRQRETASVEGFITRLKLSEDQARQLLALAAEAAPLHVEAYRARAALQPEMLEAFEAFLGEDRIDRGFTPAVEQRVGRIGRQAKTTEERITAQMLDLEKRAGEILNSGQWDLAMIRDPGAGKASRPGRGPKAHTGRRGQDRKNRTHQAPENDRLETTKRAIQQLQREIHPQVGPIGRNLLHPAASAALCRIAGTSPNQALREAAEVFERGTDEYPAATCDWQVAKLGELRAEISNWNLINGLHLDGKQIAEITALYGAAAAELRAGGQPAPRKAKRHAEQEREARVRLERSVEQVLNPGQRRVLMEFKACLVPPKNLKDPVRVGQASDRSQMEGWLARVRRMREPQLLKAVDNLLAAEAKHFGALKVVERTERAALLMETARRAAAMSDVEFEVNKADLAEKAAPCDRLQELKEEIAELSRNRNLPSTISQFMLNPRFMDQLRVRGEQLAEGAGAKVSQPAVMSEKPRRSGGQPG